MACHVYFRGCIHFGSEETAKVALFTEKIFHGRRVVSFEYQTSESTEILLSRLSIVVESSPCFSAELTGVNHLLLQAAGAEFWLVVKGLVHRACDGKVNVYAD